MADERHQLRTDMEERRESIARTVDQIEDRVHPSRIVTRRRQRARRRLSTWADTLLGSDSADDRQAVRPSGTIDLDDTDRSVMDRAAEVVPDADDARRRTRGNPIGAGLVSFGIGMMVGSLLPPSERERALAERNRDEIGEAASQLAAVGRSVGRDVGESAQDAGDQMRASATAAAAEVRSEAESAAGDVREAAT